jgi:uncharacterized BrkB/YihY/UPF0761 family membrane protein
MATNQAVRVPEAAVESSASAVHWGAIIAGALGAVGISFILISLGGALGHAAVSPWSPSGAAPTVFGRAAAIWLIVTQWLASGLGGYLAGRIVVLALGVLYRYGPSRTPARWKWLSIGTVLAALAWLAVSALFSWYLANFGHYDATYGSLGA